LKSASYARFFVACLAVRPLGKGILPYLSLNSRCFSSTPFRQVLDTIVAAPPAGLPEGNSHPTLNQARAGCCGDSAFALQLKHPGCRAEEHFRSARDCSSQVRLAGGSGLMTK
jgi:hypothetical protein